MGCSCARLSAAVLARSRRRLVPVPLRSQPRHAQPFLTMVASRPTKTGEEHDEEQACTKGDVCFNLSGVIKRVPQINKSGNREEDNRRILTRKAFIALLNLFAEDHSRIVQTLNTVQMGMVSDSALTKTGDKWPHTYTKVGRLPKYWKAALHTEVSQGQLSQEVLNKVDAKDEAAIEMIFGLVTQTSADVFLPRICLVKATCKRFFQDRISDLGKRQMGWAKKAIRNDFTIDWQAGCAYALKWESSEPNAKATGVAYINGDAAEIPTYLNVTKKFHMEQPHKDMEARLVNGAFGFNLADLFKPAGNGPRKFAITGKEKDKKDSANPWNILAKKYDDEFEQQLKHKKEGRALGKGGELLEGDKVRQDQKRAAAKQRAVEQAAKRRRVLKL